MNFDFTFWNCYFLIVVCIVEPMCLRPFHRSLLFDLFRRFLDKDFQIYLFRCRRLKPRQFSTLVLHVSKALMMTTTIEFLYRADLLRFQILGLLIVIVFQQSRFQCQNSILFSLKCFVFCF